MLKNILFKNYLKKQKLEKKYIHYLNKQTNCNKKKNYLNKQDKSLTNTS